MALGGAGGFMAPPEFFSIGGAFRATLLIRTSKWQSTKNPQPTTKSAHQGWSGDLIRDAGCRPDLRVQHSLAPLTRHPERNEQKNRSSDRCRSGRHPHCCSPGLGTMHRIHRARNSTSTRRNLRRRSSHCRSSASRPANLKNHSSSCRCRR